VNINTKGFVNCSVFRAAFFSKPAVIGEVQKCHFLHWILVSTSWNITEAKLMLNFNATAKLKIFVSNLKNNAKVPNKKITAKLLLKLPNLSSFAFGFASWQS